MEGKKLTVFVPVNGDTHRSDMESMESMEELVDYIVKWCKADDHFACIENCPYDVDQLNLWDDDVLMDWFDGDQDEYDKARIELNELLNMRDADGFIKTCWAGEVEGNMSDFYRLLKRKFDAKQKN